MAVAIAMRHDEDPASVIRKAVGLRTNQMKVLGARVLVGVYKRPKVTKGGILLTDTTKDEEKYQGKCALVLALGPIAFQDDDHHRFGNVKPKVGDWVVYNIGDTSALEIGDTRCRFVEDVDIQMIVDAPDVLW